MTKINEGIVDKVSGGVNISNYNGEIMLNKNNGYIVENGVSKNDTVSDSSDNESLKSVEVNDGVLVSIDELERGYEESLMGYGGQRVNFPCGICEVKASQVLYEDKGSLLVYLGDKRSANISPFMYYGFPGKARMCCNNVVLPSGWNERVKRGWERDEKREREW